MENDNLLVVENLKKYYPINASVLGKAKSFVKAVDDVSFTIKRGTTMGLVGESGCGKTTLGRTILRLHDVTGGTVMFKGRDLAKLSQKELRSLRPHMQMIFQDPFSSLNPAKKISWILEEPLRMQKVPKEERKKRVLAMAERVGLSA